MGRPETCTAYSDQRKVIHPNISVEDRHPSAVLLVERVQCATSQSAVVSTN